PVPTVLLLTATLAEACRSRRKTSNFAFESPTTRFATELWKDTQRPSSLICRSPSQITDLPAKLPLLAELRVTSEVVPVAVSRTNKSTALLVSLTARSLARLAKRTKRPSGVMMGAPDSRFPELTPLVLTLIRVVVPAI